MSPAPGECARGAQRDDLAALVEARNRQDVPADERMRDQVVDGAAESRPAGVEQRDAIRKARDLLQALCRPEHRDRALAGRLRDEGTHGAGSFRVEIVRRLVHEQDRRLADQSARHCQAALHSLREVARPLPLLAGEPDGRECLPRALDGLAPAKSVEPAEEDEVLEGGDAQVEGAVARGDESEKMARRPRMKAGQRHGARVGADDAARGPAAASSCRRRSGRAGRAPGRAPLSVRRRRVLPAARNASSHRRPRLRCGRRAGRTRVRAGTTVAAEG